MPTDFQYASQTDLSHYYPHYNNFSSKKRAYNFQSGLTDFHDTTLDIFYATNTGLVTELFIDGAKIDKIAFNTTETTQVATAVTPSTANFIVVDSISGFAGGDIIKVGSEYIRIEATSGDNLEFVSGGAANRGLFGTSAQHHAVDTSVYKMIDVSADVADATSGGQSYSFVYDPDLDLLLLIGDNLTDNDPNNSIIETGIDSTTYFDQMLVNASMELNNMLDKRYPTPVPKYTQYDSNTTHASSTTEYDAIIIKSTCYICVANLLRTNNRQEEADYYSNLVSNAEGTGLVDKLNKGEYKLSYEVDAKDSKGKVRTITKTGSMDIIETGGEYYGEPFDLLRVTCTTLGAYGVAKVKVEYYGSDKLFGQSEENIIVTGTLQELHSGLYVRWQGSAMAENDLWEIEVYSGSREISNASSSAVQLTRRGYSI